MAWTIDTALDHELVTVVHWNDAMGHYDIKIGELETVVSIDLGTTPDGRFTKFTVSHAIHTSAHSGPYRTSRPFNDNPPSALHQAITGLTQYYQEAVKKGHTPDESWLVPY